MRDGNGGVNTQAYLNLKLSLQCSPMPHEFGVLGLKSLVAIVRTKLVRQNRTRFIDSVHSYLLHTLCIGSSISTVREIQRHDYTRARHLFSLLFFSFILFVPKSVTVQQALGLCVREIIP